MMDFYFAAYLRFFNKTGHGLTDIIIARAEFKSVLHPEFFGQNGTYIY